MGWEESGEWQWRNPGVEGTLNMNVEVNGNDDNVKDIFKTTKETRGTPD